MHSAQGGPGRGELRRRSNTGPHATGGIRLSKQELSTLRSEIEKIDDDIIKLIARREEIAGEIGLTKRRDGVRVRDPERERKVVARAAKLAKALGADEKLAKEVARMLIADAVRIQKEVEDGPLEGQTALVVGGAGKMGEWTCRFLANKGANVKVWDPRGRLKGHSNLKSLEPAARESDIVVIASPLGVAKEELVEVISAEPKGLVMDICSVKSHIAGTLRMAAAEGVKIASVHPMFGPGTPTVNGMNVVICDCGSKQAVAEARKLFESSGAQVAQLYLEEHDRMMAYVLGLSHLTALMFGRAVSSSDRRLSELREVQGTSFSRLADLAREVSSESRRVYHDIQLLNPHTKEMVDAMDMALSEVKEAALEKDHERFIRIMDMIEEYTEG